jgi:sugar phosphate isomerase/epimerase
VLDFARQMGIEYLSADPDPDSFDTLDKLVEEYGVNLGIHNHGPKHRWEKIDTIAAAIKNHSARIGCCVDTGHFLRSREDPVRAVEVFGPRVYGVHLKDVKDATRFTLLGEGDLRTSDLLKALARLNYRYGLNLEYEENPKAPLDDIRACLKATREAVATLQ